MAASSAFLSSRFRFKIFMSVTSSKYLTICKKFSYNGTVNNLKDLLPDRPLLGTKLAHSQIERINCCIDLPPPWEIFSWMLATNLIVTYLGLDAFDWTIKGCFILALAARNNQPIPPAFNYIVKEPLTSQALVLSWVWPSSWWKALTY